MKNSNMHKYTEESKLPTTNTEQTLLENAPSDNQSKCWNISQEDSSNNATFKLGLNEDNLTNKSLDSNNGKFEAIFSKNNRLISFSDIRLFTFFMCLIVMLTNALTVGYRNSVITTIEKRFEFSSMSSGILSGILEIGSLITTLIMSYFFSNSHIPKCVAVSSVVCGLASIVYSLPHFLTNSYNPSLLSNKTNDKLLCFDNISQNFFEYKVKMENEEKTSHAINSILDKLDIKSHCLLKSSNIGVFMIFSFANVLIGSTSAPLYTLGTSYIDSYVNKDSSSIYLAFIYSMLAFGPLVGYLVGAGFLQINANHFNFNSNDIYLNDSSWIGAWHLGFILFGILIILTAMVFFLFPKEMKKRNEPNESESCKSDKSYGDLKNLPKAIFNLIKNRVFMIVTFAFCFEITIISGFMTFLPKYLEHQFSLNNSLANVYTGGIAIPGAIVGIVSGGFLVKKFKIDPKGASILATCCNILCLCGILALIFIGCPNIKMAGTTASYSTNKYTLLESKKIELEKLNLSSECNRECACSTSFFEPVCGRNQITYFSPCYAGCTEYAGTDSNAYHSCKCVQKGKQNDTLISDATSGSCTYDCKMLFPFLGVLFFITFLTSLNQMPMLMVTLRSVSEIERPFALGLQLVIMRLLAYIPSPLIFGQAIDHTCLLWRKDECDKIGSCLFYNREKFRFVYGSIAWIYKAFSLFFFIFLYISVRKFTLKKNNVNIDTMLRASLHSLDAENKSTDEFNRLKALNAKQNKFASPTKS